MGYTTDFDGQLTLSKPLTKKQFDFLEKLKDTRRMKRDVSKLMETYKGKHGYPGRTADKNTPEEIYGIEGEFFVHEDETTGVIDYNIAPGQVSFLDDSSKAQPGLWLQWEVLEGDDENDPQVLQWDGGEKFYNYTEWLQYLIDRFFNPWGIMLNGEIEWVGEDSSDRGKIVVKNNVMEVYEGKTVYKKK
jgi:hypothetical protein